MSRIRSAKGHLENLVAEIRSHWQLEDCDGVLSLLEIYEDSEFIQLVLEYQEGGTLHDYIKTHGKFHEMQARIVME
jgi:hypothetical protein